MKLVFREYISFEEVIAALENNQLLDIVQSNQNKYPGQNAYVVQVNNYVLGSLCKKE